jgi:hypothetical protein
MRALEVVRRYERPTKLRAAGDAREAAGWSPSEWERDVGWRGLAARGEGFPRRRRVSATGRQPWRCYGVPWSATR